MKIFVAYGYNPRDEWISEMVFPVVEAFGAQIETGEVTYGGSIPQSVRTKIERSDAVLAFTTRRLPNNDGGGAAAIPGLTHHWVIQELGAAYALGKPAVEVRETGVDNQGGLTENNQRIEYDEARRDECLVKIVQAVGALTSGDLVRVQLLPQGIYEDLLPLLDDGALSCQYTIRVGNFESQPVAVGIDPIKGGLFVGVSKAERDALFRIKIRYGNRLWLSDYQSLDAYKIDLRAAGGI